MIDLERVFKRAARSALMVWKGEYSDEDDLANDLWVWYLKRPGTQRKMAKLTANEAMATARIAALQMLSGKQMDDNEFTGRNPYSSDNIKEALRGVSNNRYLQDILPLAMTALDSQNAGQAEAIRLRYDDGVVPARGSAEEAKLKRAVKSLTEHVNIIAITAGLERDSDGNLLDKQGPGSRNAVFPETRKAQGDGYSDPTANIAIMLIEHPELRDEYLYETPLPEFLEGRCHAEPA